MKKIGIKLKIVRLLMHIPAGLIIGFGCDLGWAYGLGFLGLFCVYEINEDKNIHDQAFYDIIGAIVGLGGFIIVKWLVL